MIIKFGNELITNKAQCSRFVNDAALLRLNQTWAFGKSGTCSLWC